MSAWIIKSIPSGQNFSEWGIYSRWYKANDQSDRTLFKTTRKIIVVLELGTKRKCAKYPKIGQQTCSTTFIFDTQTVVWPFYYIVYTFPFIPSHRPCAIFSNLLCIYMLENYLLAESIHFSATSYWLKKCSLSLRNVACCAQCTVILLTCSSPPFAVVIFLTLYCYNIVGAVVVLQDVFLTYSFAHIELAYLALFSSFYFYQLIPNLYACSKVVIKLSPEVT